MVHAGRLDEGIEVHVIIVVLFDDLIVFLLGLFLLSHFLVIAFVVVDLVRIEAIIVGFRYVFLCLVDRILEQRFFLSANLLVDLFLGGFVFIVFRGL